MPEPRFYRLAPGVDVVPLRGGGVCYRSESLNVKVEGASAATVAGRLGPLLDGAHPFEDLAAALPEFPADEVRDHLDGLARSGVLRVRARAAAPGPTGPLAALVEALGADPDEAQARLDGARVAVFGLEGHGAHAALLLAAAGVGDLLLVDPYPLHPENLPLVPAAAPADVGRPRERVLADAIAARGGGTRARASGAAAPLTRDAVAELAAGRDLLLGCFDRGFVAVHHWLNRASLDSGIPALYSEARGVEATAGPFVIPGATACFLCYRMRAVACEREFEPAIEYEEFLDARRRPELHARPQLPPMAGTLGGLLAAEALKRLLGVAEPALAGAVLDVDSFSLRSAPHPVLQEPECPACGKPRRRADPSPLPELCADDSAPGRLAAEAARLVSPRTGIVRALEVLPKDPTEPALPFVVRADVANHSFAAPEAARTLNGCSGKGMTLEDARTGALGEAVERYSGARWSPGEVVRAPRAALDGPSLDPRELVLFADWQYAAVPYQPYRDDAVLGWVPARSLVSGDRVWVPALSVFLTYPPASPGEYLFPVTSNGLAAGATRAGAVLAAVLEVLERDAFMATWLHRLPCEAVDPAAHPDADVRGLHELYRRRGVELRLFRLPADHSVPVYAAVALQEGKGDGPAAVVGMGADLDGARAARKALLEVAQIRPALRRRMRGPEAAKRRDELVEDPRRVATLEDHDLLYADPRALGEFRFLLDRPVARDHDWGAPPPAEPGERLARLAAELGAAGNDVLYVDLTPPDMLPLRLYTARALVPGFQPIDFGWRERRLGGARLYELPGRLGLAPGVAPGTLNDAPHPVS